jgi:HK97 family phage portal protein
MARLSLRAIRPPPPDDITPNPNDPASVPPSTVGPDQLVQPGDPDGVVLTGADPPAWQPPTIIPSAWSGWPAEWWPPYWNGSMQTTLTDTAWMCVDYNAQQLSTMPPYLKDAAPSLQADWLNNPDPDAYPGGWSEFAHQLFWDYQLGEAFVLVTARYSTGWPARFHVVPPWSVEIDIVDGLNVYSIGQEDVTNDLLHIKYKSQVGSTHGVGPLEAGSTRVIASQMLVQYATSLAAGGGVPTGVLQHPAEQTPAQAAQLKADWVAARTSAIGEPAVLSGGIEWKPTQINPHDMALTALLDKQESRIAYLLGVPSELLGIPVASDPMTYKNVSMWTDLHWRTGLMPKATRVMAAMSQWALPRGTTIELNRDQYVAAPPLERAQTAQVLHSIVDPVTGEQALTVQEIRAAERLDNSTPSDLSSGVLK